MPEVEHKPGSPFQLAFQQALTLSAAASDGVWLVRARCPSCGQAIYMLPADVERMLGHDQRIASLRMDCQTCRVRVRVKPMPWRAGDRLEIRRPAPNGGWLTVVAAPGELQ